MQLLALNAPYRPEGKIVFTVFAVHSHGPPGSRLRRQRGRGRAEKSHERVRYRRTSHHRCVGKAIEHPETRDQRRVQSPIRKGNDTSYDYILHFIDSSPSLCSFRSAWVYAQSNQIVSVQAALVRLHREQINQTFYFCINDFYFLRIAIPNTYVFHSILVFKNHRKHFFIRTFINYNEMRKYMIIVQYELPILHERTNKQTFLYFNQTTFY